MLRASFRYSMRDRDVLSYPVRFQSRVRNFSLPSVTRAIEFFLTRLQVRVALDLNHRAREQRRVIEIRHPFESLLLLSLSVLV